MFKILGRVMSYAKNYRRYFIFTIFFALIGVSLSLAVPIFIGKAVDFAIGKGEVDFNSIIKIVLNLVFIVLISGIFQWFMSLCTNKLSYLTVKDLRCDVFEKIENLPVKYLDSKTKGDITSRVINDVETISDGLLQGFTQLLTGIITILGTIIFMLTINIKISLVVFVLTPVSFLVASKITKLTHDTFLKQSQIRGDMLGLVEEMISGQKIVKSFRYEERAEQRFENINADFGEIGAKATFYSSVTNPATRFVNGIIYASVGVLGALAVIGDVSFIGVMTVGNLTSFLAYANQYTKPFNEISGVVAELQNAVACAERVFDILDEEEVSDDSNMPDLEINSGEVRFENIMFSYVSGTRLIENFNLYVKNGQRIAIVGPTGCGKSTIINLLLRFYDIESGKIFISGEDIQTVSKDSLRKSFGMVLQETWIFTGTIRENIAYGKSGASDEEIISAAKAVYAHSFIKRLPKGYDTIISDNSGLSAGQKQLICIARIMLMNPPLLILDEATSSIDLRTEQRIQKAFETLMIGKTSFIIAHRLSTIKNADIILVMKDGNIIEQGSHDSLINKNGFYADLYNSQFLNENPRP